MSKTFLRVATLWNDTVSTEVQVQAGQSVTIGEKPTSTLMLPPSSSLPKAQVTLIKGAKAGFQLDTKAVSGAVGGKLVQGDSTRNFGEFKDEGTITLHPDYAENFDDNVQKMLREAASEIKPPSDTREWGVTEINFSLDESGIKE